MSGTRNGRLNVSSGVTCVVDGTLNGGVTVRNGGSLVVSDGSTIHGGLTATGAGAVHVFGVQVFGDVTITGASDVSIANTRFQGNLTLTDNQGRVIDVMPTVTRNYGVVLVGNRVNETLTCTGNDPGVTDFDVPNTVIGSSTGQCEEL